MCEIASALWSPAELITALQLVRHPEGGWYREVYRSAGCLPAHALPATFGGSPRAYSTSIYFLLERGDVSALHRIKSDELWYFHTGASLTIHVVTPDGIHSEISLGAGIGAGEIFQGVVPAGAWFGAEVAGPEAYSLVSCSVSPGFDFSDFELGDRNTLLPMFPEHAALIRRLTPVRGAAV